MIWYVVFKTKAHRRPVPGCGSQRILHALGRRSHPADHGPSFASLYSPFCRYATSSPDRGKSLLAGSGRRRCCSNPLGSHPQQLLTVFRAERSLLVDIPTGWEPRTEQQPTGLIAHPAAQGRAVRILPDRTKKKSPGTLCLGFSWCDREDSNLWPSGSEPNALPS